MNRIENTYEQWMKEEGVPIINEYVCSIYQEGMEETWGTGAFIRLEGSEGSYRSLPRRNSTRSALKPESTFT
jgi:hypothetical protein